MSGRHELLALVAGCATLYLTGLGDIPFYTRGEPREGLVVREMLRTGTWLVPARPEGELARKPPLYYWSAAPLLALLPERAELALRLPSAAAATAAVVGVWATARAAFGPAAALPAGIVLAAAFEWTRAATSARVDMLLAAALTAVLAGWTLALVRGGGGWLGIAIAGTVLGVLAKGPVALMLPGLAAGALVVVDRDAARRLRPFLVLGVAAALAGIWYGVAVQQEGASFLEIVGRENVRRFVDTDAAETGHAHGIAYLVPLGLVGFLPWAPLLPLAFGPLAARPRPGAATLAGAWSLCGLVFFSLAAGKRSVYLLPLYPAVALLLGAAVTSAGDGVPARLARLGAALYAPATLLLAVVTAAVALGVDPATLLHPWLKPRDAEGAAALAARARAIAAPLLAVAVVSAAAAPMLARAARDGAFRWLVLVVGMLMVVWTATFDALLHPAIARDRSQKTFLAQVDRLVPPDVSLYARYPPDPGVRFYAPRSLRALPREGVGEDSHALLWEDEWRRLVDAVGRPLRVVAVSTARQSRRGHLALVVVPAGPLRARPEVAGPPSPGGLRTGS